MSTLNNPPTLNSLNPLGFWDGAIGILSRELSPQQFKTWIQPLRLLSFEVSDQSLTIGAPNRFKLDWIKKTFADRFQELAEHYFGFPVNLSFVLDAGAVDLGLTAPTPTLNPSNSEPDLTQASQEDEVLTEERSFEIEDHSN